MKGLSSKCGSLAASNIWPMERDLRHWAVSAYVYAGGVCSELTKKEWRWEMRVRGKKAMVDGRERV